MLQSHITLTPWLPAPHQHPMQPRPNPRKTTSSVAPYGCHLYPSRRSPLPAMLLFLEWNQISHALCAGSGRWWKSVQVGSRVVFSWMHSHVNGKKASGSALVSSKKMMHRRGQNETTQKKQQKFYISRLCQKRQHAKPLQPLCSFDSSSSDRARVPDSLWVC